MKSWIAHYKNKYPGGKVHATESSLDVYDAAGNHCVALQKDGAGQWKDVSEAMGCEHAHCLAPIPKDTRVHKVCKQTGNLKLDEEAEARLPLAMELSKKFGKVPSCEELEKQGLGKFDEKQRSIKQA